MSFVMKYWVFVFSVLVELSSQDCHGHDSSLKFAQNSDGPAPPYRHLPSPEERVENVFFLRHEDECTHPHPISHTLQALGLPDHIGAQVTQKAHEHAALRHLQEDKTTTTTARTLSASAAAALNASLSIPLKSISMTDRRDLLMAALELAVIRKKGVAEFLRRGDAIAAVSEVKLEKHYLPNLKMDIVHNTALENDGVFELAKALPCMRYPPEKNKPRYTAAEKIPNDLTRDISGHFRQWHFVGTAQSENAGSEALDAWQCFTGQGQKGEIVGVVDTGCSMHPDLEQNICTSAECAGYDYGDDDNNPHDEPLDCVHGTVVAGAIAAVNNNHFGVSGMCWGCRLSCYKVYDSIFKTLGVGAILRAIDDMLGKKIRVSNHSFASYGTSTHERDAYLSLKEAGHIAVLAAGNDGCNIDIPSSRDPSACKDEHGNPLPLLTPAGYNLENMIVVGSLGHSDRISWFSNYGKKLVHLMAPGEDLLLLTNTLLAQSGVARGSGTSFSSPIVAGVVGLIWSRNPGLSAQQVRDLILKNVDVQPQYEDVCQTGGKLNVKKIMEAMGGQCTNATFMDVKKPAQDNTLKYYSETGSARCISIGVSLFIVAVYLIAF